MMKIKALLCLCLISVFMLVGCGEPENAKDVIDSYNSADKQPCHIEAEFDTVSSFTRLDDKQTETSSGHFTVSGDLYKNIFCGEGVEVIESKDYSYEIYYDAETGRYTQREKGKKDYYYHNRRTFINELLSFDFSNKEKEKVDFDQNDNEYILKVDMDKTEYHGFDKFLYFYYGQAIVNESELESGTLILKFDKNDFLLKQLIAKDITVSGESSNGIYGSWGTKIKTKCVYNGTVDFSKYGEVKEPVIPDNIKKNAKSLEVEERKQE